MRRVYVLFLLFGSMSGLRAQCLTDLKSLLPERNAKIDFRSTQVATGRNYLVLSNTLDDTTGYFDAGAAYVFEKSPAGWNYIALLKPSNPSAYLQFGYKLTVDSLTETIAIASYGYLPSPVLSEVYVYRKPSSGWISMTESERIKLPDTLSNISALKLSNDGLSMGVGLMYNNQGTGTAWIYDRGSKAVSFSVTAPVQIPAPATSVEFGSDIAIDKRYVAVSCQQYSSASGAIVVYRRDKLSAYPKIAVLRADPQAYPFGTDFRMKDNSIVSPGLTYSSNNNSYQIVFYIFTKKEGEDWKDSDSSVWVAVSEDAKTPSSWRLGFEILDSTTLATSFQYGQSPIVFGSSTTGTIELLSKTGPSWTQASRNFILEEPLGANFFYSNSYGTSLSWNGSQLVFAPTLDGPGSATASSATSLTLSNGIWGSAVKVTIPYLTANNFRFGYSIVKEGYNLLVAVPHDSEAGPNAGAVTIYSKDNSQNWIKTGKILPPRNLTTDTFFGSCVAANDSLLAVGAPNYGLPGGGGYIGGKVFLYKRPGPGWESYSLQQTISAPDNLYEFGWSIGISSTVLAVSGFGTGVLSGTQNSMAIYERKNDVWQLQQTINFNNAWLHSTQTKIVVRNDSIFVFSGLGGNATEGTGVFIITKNSSNVWVTTTTFQLPFGDYYSNYSPFSLVDVSIEVGRDHVFVGLPAMAKGSVPSVGAVFVYSKRPGQPWSGGIVPSSSIIYPKDPVAYGYFGYSISNIENTIAVGAPGTSYETVNNQLVTRNKPGATYIIAAKDFDWKDYEHFLILQGISHDLPLKDNMGFVVDTDYDTYFTSAPNENNGQGTQAGAVYTISTPPLVKLVAPVCQDGGQQKLFGYPFGGVWSGPGLLNGQNAFDPLAVGPGKYLLSYKTPNCAYEGKLLVEVLPVPSPPVVLTPLVMSICPEHPQNIQIQPVNTATYKWYFTSPNHSSTVVIAGQDQPDLMVGLSGYYFCEITVNSCSTDSPVITVNYETPTSSIGPQLVICQKEHSVQLQASPSGGIWKGGNVGSDGIFSPTGLPNGSYPVSYSFLSPSGCQYVLRDTVVLAAIPAVIIQQLPGDYCTTGLVALQTDQRQADWTYSWKYQINPSSTWNVVDTISQPTRTFVLEGFYKVSISNGLCSGDTGPVKVGLDRELSITTNPPDSLISVCQQDQTTLTATARSGTVFEWWMSVDQNGRFTEIGNGNSLIVKDAGFYKVQGTLGFCFSETKVQEVYFYPIDSLIVPNVFTPNGDESNPEFEMIGNITPSSFVIVNRWGEEVYRSSRVLWDGGGSPGGVYFWMISYKDCFQQERKVKGYVQLVR